jgi:hypothetical protein
VTIAYAEIHELWVQNKMASSMMHVFGRRDKEKLTSEAPERRK